MLKNRIFQGASHTTGIPNNPSGIAPDFTTSNAQIRFNTTNNKLEFYSNITQQPLAGGWNAIATQGNTTITKTSFTGNGVAVQFWPLGYSSGDENLVLVHVGTVYQIPTTNYTFGTGGNAGNIIFSSAPSGGAAITIIGGFASTISTLA
jgi:hypothetical protein